MTHLSGRHNLFQICFILTFLLLTSFRPVFSAEICDINEDGAVTNLDIDLIFQARNTPANTPFDARDIDRDSFITVKDARRCICIITACNTPAPTNSSPIANPGFNQVSKFQEDSFQSVTLDGSASMDPDGDALNFLWEIQSRPAGSQALLTQTTIEKTSFTPDIQGRYIIALTITDGFGSSHTEVATIDAQNNTPIANAGMNATLFRNSDGLFNTMTLDGSHSSDIDGNTLTFQWEFISLPSGSRATLNDPRSATPIFTPDLDGEYLIQLIVNDGTTDSIPDTVAVTTGNTQPVANAGPDQTIFRDNSGRFMPVTLQGDQSTDIDGNHLNYKWSFVSFPSGSQANIENPETIHPTFTPDQEGLYVIQLIVNDGDLNSEPDTITISTGNTQPVANAGSNRLIRRNISGNFTPHTLNGTGSTDIDGDSLFFRWDFLSLPNGSHVTLNDPKSVRPTFTPDLDGKYIIQLIVNDGTTDSVATTVTITTGNTQPIANAGPDQTIFRHTDGQFTNVTLEGSLSTDVDGDSLNYRWSFVSFPNESQVKLQNTDKTMPTFTPDMEGTYVVQLIVNDKTLDSSPDTVIISTGNTRPIANAGPDQTIFRDNSEQFMPVTLEGDRSTDIDGNSLSYRWSFVSFPSGSDVNLQNLDGLMPKFTPDLEGIYTIQLIVNDGILDSKPDTVTVSTGNTRPIADAGLSQIIQRDTSGNFSPVTLDGSHSTDIDGDNLSFHWSEISSPTGSQVSLSDPNSVKPTFTPDVDLAGDYVWQLIVNDSQVDSKPNTVVISTNALPAPIANAGTDQRISRDGDIFFPVTLDGGLSSQSGAGSLNFIWSLISQPTGSQAILNNVSTQNPTLTPDLKGDYLVQLIVNDNLLDSSPDTVLLTAENTIPVADAGLDQTHVPLSTTFLDGSQSFDADSDSLNYQWSLTTRPTGSNATLTNPNSANPEFIPDVEGIYVAQLIVNDGEVTSTPDTVTITTNRRPVADAGKNQSAQLVQDFNTQTAVVFIADAILNGSASKDPDGDNITYEWSYIPDPDITKSPASFLTDITLDKVSVRMTEAGDYKFQLVVDDGELKSQSEVFVRVINVNLVSNGDFESGDSEFDTDYHLGIGGGANGAPGEQGYNITTNPRLVFNKDPVASYQDHTSGSGNMMAVNAATVANQLVWGQEVSLTANTDYEFSIWVSSWSPLSPANLAFDIGGLFLGSFDSPSETSIWSQYSFTFNSGSTSGIVLLRIIATSPVFSGNDFALDDISLTTVSF